MDLIGLFRAFLLVGLGGPEAGGEVFGLGRFGTGEGDDGGAEGSGFEDFDCCRE